MLTFDVFFFLFSISSVSIIYMSEDNESSCPLASIKLKPGKCAVTQAGTLS